MLSTHQNNSWKNYEVFPFNSKSVPLIFHGLEPKRRHYFSRRDLYSKKLRKKFTIRNWKKASAFAMEFSEAFVLSFKGSTLNFQLEK